MTTSPKNSWSFGYSWNWNSCLRASIVIVAVTAAILMVLPEHANALSDAPGLAWSYGGGEAYLFPGVAGMSNPTTSASYGLQTAATVTATVVDLSGTVVKTLQVATSQPACDYYCYSITWDGTNNKGKVVALGQYTMEVEATNQGGTDTIDALRDVADPGAPGSLTSPTNGATIQGTTGFVFTPSSSFPSSYSIDQVNVSCIGASYGPSNDGTWQGSGDTDQCGNGSQALTDSVYFTDPLGNSQSWTDPNPPTVTISNPPGVSWGTGGSEEYLFPNDSGMANETTYAGYNLQNAANVSVTILNAGGKVVRTLQTSVSEPACQGYYYCYYVSWDGTNDQGQVVSPGQYSIQVEASNQSADQTIDALRDVADPGAPGSLTSPTNGATIQGTTGFVFTPSSSFPSSYSIDQVNVSCIGASYGPSNDGTWQGSGDTDQCGNGSQALTDSVYFTDPLGSSQSWTDPNPPTVTISNPTPPDPSWTQGSAEAYFFPGDPGMDSTTTYAGYDLQNDSTVTITVLDSNGNVVKTLQSATEESACNYYCYYVSWDGTNDQGQVVSPGQYSIQVEASNQSADQTIDALRDVADPGAPGSLTSPTNGATIQGTTGFVFTPSSSFPSSYSIDQVNVSCIGASYGPSNDGTWQGSGDTDQCGNGSQALTDSVYFTDPLGSSQSWTDPNPPTVTISNPTPPDPSWTQGSAEAYFFPGDPGMDSTTTYAGYDLQNDSTVTITVLDSNGNVVKTLQSATEESACNYYCYYVSWDGTNDQGQVVSPGQYSIQVEALTSRPTRRSMR